MVRAPEVTSLPLFFAALVASSCAGIAPQAIKSPPPPFTFEGARAKELVIPVTLLNAGTRTVTEAVMTADEVGVVESHEDPAVVTDLLTQNGYLSGYVRRFEFDNGGAVPNRRQVAVLLVRDSAAAKAVVEALTDIRVRNGFSEFSIGGRIGDDSRMVGVNLRIPDAAGDKITVAFEVAYAYLNAAVFSVMTDDQDSAKGQDAIDLARLELQYIRDALTRATPRPS